MKLFGALRTHLSTCETRSRLGISHPPNNILMSIIKTINVTLLSSFPYISPCLSRARCEYPGTTSNTRTCPTDHEAVEHKISPTASVFQFDFKQFIRTNPLLIHSSRIQVWRSHLIARQDPNRPTHPPVQPCAIATTKITTPTLHLPHVVIITHPAIAQRPCRQIRKIFTRKR